MPHYNFWLLTGFLSGLAGTALAQAPAAPEPRLVIQYDEPPFQQLIRSPGPPFYAHQVVVPNTAKAVLYRRAYAWLVATTGTKPVQDSVAGRTSTSGLFMMTSVDPSMYSVMVRISIAIDEGGYKVRFDDLSLNDKWGNVPFYYAGRTYYNTHGVPRKLPQREKVLAATDKEINRWAAALQLAMEGRTP
jgi:hypothetical protein